ncbi:MAG: DEAD/DEAH box helicase family protein [bacterium]|nr:DEAD/DEAH box helicase family protein [bacterium]
MTVLQSPNLLPFQRDAIEALIMVFARQWKKAGRQLPIVFKSPTGSGKTLMAAHFIRGLNHLPQWDEDKAFIWITFSDDLAMQSRDKFKEYFDNNLENGLLTVADINQGLLKSNDILFLNWQKVVSEAAENRILRRPGKDDPLYKERGKYFEDVIDGTKAKKREIVLVIDEAHKSKGTRLAQNIIDYIDPKIILHITATPEEVDELEAYRQKSFVEVDREPVVAQGLIKEKIVLQSDEDLKGYGKKDLDEVLLDLGLSKRAELVAEFKAMGKDINPLMLIQLPNDDKELTATGDRTKEEIVSAYLKKKDVPGHKIAKWFDKYKVNLEGITGNDNKIDFMLFKQAAGTGWDCPRASVLVMFREIKSNKFYTQTIGRILRMPEPYLKDDYNTHPALRLGYLYTNYKRKEVKIPDQSEKNQPITKETIRKNGIKNVELPTVYASRVDYGDIPRSMIFQKSFIDSMNSYFGITSKDVLGIAQKKLKKKGVDISSSLSNRIVANAEFEDFDQLAYDFIKRGDDVSLEMSINDVEKTFNYLCYRLLKEQDDEQARYSNIARSWSVLKSATRLWMESIFGADSDYYYRVFVKDIQKDASSVFRPAITKALRDFKPTREKLIEDKKKKLEKAQTHTFTILEKYGYTEDYKEVPQALCALDTFYLLPDYPGRDNELKFKNYIDTKKKEIEWWFKNGNYGKDYLAIPYRNTEDKKDALFYPDWIIRFKDGRVGIFDTKAGNTGTPQETKDKAVVLTKWIERLGKNYVGGIAIFENGIWYYNDSTNYKYIKGKSVNTDKRWREFENLLKLT